MTEALVPPNFSRSAGQKDLGNELSRDEQLRLEALNQANMSLGTSINPTSAESVLRHAKVFEDYLRNGSTGSKK